MGQESRYLQHTSNPSLLSNLKYKILWESSSCIRRENVIFKNFVMQIFQLLLPFENMALKSQQLFFWLYLTRCIWLNILLFKFILIFSYDQCQFSKYLVSHLHQWHEGGCHLFLFLPKLMAIQREYVPAYFHPNTNVLAFSGS